MGNYYLAVDIGASGGRHILASKRDGKLVLEEVYRFDNGMDYDGNRLYWDVDRLFKEVFTGMKKCAEVGKIPQSMGIDTWAVDYILMDKNGNKISHPTAYRDIRTEGMDKEVYQFVSEKELYKRTGIQKQPFNTIYQLMALKEKESELMKKADKLLLIPDYLHYMLTGVMVTEYTNATTTQLISPTTKDWDWELIDILGYPKKFFTPIKEPGFYIGNLSARISEEVGFSCKVVLPPTHDTASAVMAVPARIENILYISSGTWSLIGTEQKRADCSDKSRRYNFTNEGGYDYRFRYLKNIMGLWMIQSVKKEIGEEFSYEEICERASKSTITSLVDCNHSRFLSPSNMTKEVQNACLETNQEVPKGIVDVAAVIYNSLAMCYKKALEEIEEITGHVYDQIHIVGGGSNADYLNQITANITGKTVYAGPAEATAVGNLCCQMIAEGEFTDLANARNCIFQSFQIKEYKYKGGKL